MRITRSVILVLCAAAVLVAALTLPIISIKHSFPSYHENTELEFECFWIHAKTNIGISRTGIGSCGAVMREINTDNSQIYLVVPAAVSRQAEAIDYVVCIAMPSLVLALLSKAAPQRTLTSLLSKNLLGLAAICGILLVNLGQGLQNSIHAAPDPGAITTSSVGAGFLLLTGVPLLILASPT